MRTRIVLAIIGALAAAGLALGAAGSGSVSATHFYGSEPGAVTATHFYGAQPDTHFYG